MGELSREQRINAAFVTVADTLIADYDLIDLLHTLVEVCAEVLDVEAGGLVLADEDGELQLLASTSEQADLVEIMQLSAGAGPCVDCFRTGSVVQLADIAESGERWPEFQAAALGQGFRAVHATPMRLRGQVLGALNLFSNEPGILNSADAGVAQALADVATIGILQERSIRETGIVAEQLQWALESRVIIEQAKGVLSALEQIGVDAAFTRLRDHARNHNMTLRAVAEGVTARTLNLSPRPKV
ncbi:GAF and ANTAR domain-containing protein [Pseudolysinimonas sp.]|uniref:GAF and ANTAR domain-containing protein n=1 Tax=Pseudolysinimonas sp. TaxID=2680009 RepID=UPI00286C52BB|nr:GAF and ANTAR domain-containing protein [Pseudolysinimonas sp.]